MSFLPDLASWALRGQNNEDEDGENSNNNNNGQSLQSNDNNGNNPKLTEDEIRAKRMARLAMLESKPPAQEEEEEDTTGTKDGDGDEMMKDASPKNNEVPMDVDNDDEKKPAAVDTPEKPSTAATPPAASKELAPKPPPPTESTSDPSSRKKKKISPSGSNGSNSAVDKQRKINRKKRELLRKVLRISLSSSSPTSTTMSDKLIVVVDADIDPSDNGITVQSIAEILASRLALSPDAPELSSCPMTDKTLVSYLAGCHTRTIREKKEIRDRSSSSGSSRKKSVVDESEIESILDEIQKQVVSYAASSLMEPDLFESGADGPMQLASCLVAGVGDPSNSIAFGQSGPGTSFYACLCEELLEQDGGGGEVFGGVVRGVVDCLCKALLKCETVLDTGSSADDSTSSTSSSSSIQVTGSGLTLVSALTSLCSHKAAAQQLSRSPSFLLPPPNTPTAAERVATPLDTTSLPPNATPQQQRLYRMMAAMTSGRNNPMGLRYLRRSGPALERETILGMILRLGLPMENSAVVGAFQGAAGRTMADVMKSTDGMRRQLGVYQEGCNQFIMALIKSGAEVRGKVMDWFADALLVNIGATALRPDKAKVSTHATLLNLNVVLMKLCQPFVDNPKRSKLINHGFVSSPLDHKGVYTTEGDDAIPRLAENPSSPTETYAPKNTFIPQCFFFTARSLHLGLVSSASHHHNLIRQVQHTGWSLRNRNADVQSDPNFNHILALQYANEVSLLMPDFVGDALRFYGLMSNVLGGMGDVNVLGRMPEFFVEDVCDVLTFVCRFAPKSMRGIDFGDVFRLVVKLLTPEYAQTVRNYNLRAKLGDVLHDIFLPPTPNSSRTHQIPDSVSTSTLTSLPHLLSDPSALQTLAPSLLLLYGEVEHTGYYEKRTHRANIASMLQYLWSSAEHRPAFRRITQNQASFIKFANGIMNETNSLIASVMEKLPEIRRVQVQMADATEWGGLTDEQRETISSRHEENEHEVKSALPLCNKTLQMLGFLNTDQDIRNLFLLEEMCPRLVNMLFHVLMKLVGSKGLELKVDNPESLNFKPKEMLRDLCAIFATFASAKEFQMECARSGYYNSELVTKSVKTCRRLNLLSGDAMEAFASLTDRVQEAARNVEDYDELTKDAPDEFLDPILLTFMKDPVILPTSDKIVDRSTITQHLLNDPHDPFNRKELTIEMIKPAADLKGRMVDWLNEKRKQVNDGGGKSS